MVAWILHGILAMEKVTYTLAREDVTHTYEFPGVYEVLLIATDLTTCTVKDTAELLSLFLTFLNLSI